MDFHKIEEKWQEEWEKAKIFEAEPSKKKKFFLTFPFPYMNGPLHIGHAFTATRVDVFARFKRMQGFNVLFPWAWHYTGQPIPGTSKRIAENDEKLIKAIKELDGVPEEELKKFVDPLYLANYYRRDAEINVKRAGFSVDLRRQFTTIDPHFNKFIEWQYLTLKDKKYVIKGTHPVVYCTKCKSPTGDHDRLEGEGVSPAEFVFLKFKYDDVILPAATLRLETIYGVTNMWVNPDVVYVKAKINDETWILSEECAFKLKNQDFKVKELGKIKGTELIGKYCYNPVLKNKIIILPASFVDPAIGSGIVMSVPSHAPYDYIGLKILQERPEELKKYGIDPKVLEKIKPISLIKLEGFEEHPAIEICEQMKIKTLNKEKLDKATEEIYKKEFHSGVLKKNTGKYSGKRVIEVKPIIIKDFVKANIATRIYDLPEKVVCRCTTPCIVKILQDQWFLKFSDKKWKELCHKCLEKMIIYPEEAKNWFRDVIDWLNDKACARRSGLGTKLPWDKKWLVETLSDSTIYMAFYTISHLIKKHNIKPEQLTREVLDFIFLGKPMKKDGLEKIWKEMRDEFTYWYPVDFRNSAKELIPNHLTFYIFHHVAIFPEKFWPRMIGVNGMLDIEGQKMSKSKGIFITLNKALNDYGADTLRFALMNTSEGLEDVNFRKKDAETAIRTLQSFYSNIVKSFELKTRKKKTSVDVWLISKLQEHITNATNAYERTKFKTVMKHAFFNVFNDFKLYIRRSKKVNREVLENFVSNWIRLISPIIPHICEELWEKIGNKKFVSLAEWPKADEKLIDKKILELESIFINTLKDLNHVIKITRKRRNAYLYVATEKELNYIKESLDLVKEQFGFKKVKIFLVSDPKRYDPQNKAKKARFGKPGIFIE